MQTHAFDKKAGTFDWTDSSLESIPSSEKYSPNSHTPPASLDPLVACSSCEGDVLGLAENGVTHTGCGDLTTDGLLKVLEGAADVLYWREEDEELIGMIHTMTGRLRDNDSAEIADDARHAIPHLHYFWCGNAQHYDLTADDTDDEGIAALVHGTPEQYTSESYGRRGQWAPLRRGALRQN